MVEVRPFQTVAVPPGGGGAVDSLAAELDRELLLTPDQKEKIQRITNEEKRIRSSESMQFDRQRARRGAGQREPYDEFHDLLGLNTAAGRRALPLQLRTEALAKARGSSTPASPWRCRILRRREGLQGRHPDAEDHAVRADQPQGREVLYKSMCMLHANLGRERLREEEIQMEEEILRRSEALRDFDAQIARRGAIGSRRPSMDG